MVVSIYLKTIFLCVAISEINSYVYHSRKQTLLHHTCFGKTECLIRHLV